MSTNRTLKKIRNDEEKQNNQPFRWGIRDYTLKRFKIYNESKQPNQTQQIQHPKQIPQPQQLQHKQHNRSNNSVSIKKPTSKKDLECLLNCNKSNQSQTINISPSIKINELKESPSQYLSTKSKNKTNDKSKVTLKSNRLSLIKAEKNSQNINKAPAKLVNEPMVPKNEIKVDPSINFNLKVYSSQELNTDYDHLTTDQSNPIIIKALGYEISRNDLSSLTNGYKLNDIIVNFYFKLLCNSNSTFKCTTLDSILISKILNSNLRGISKSLEKVSKVDFKLLLCPLFINENHWALLAYDTVLKVISYYDSIYSVNLNIINKMNSVLSKYIKCMSCCDTWEVSSENSYPKQTNSNDCGVFICTYAKYLVFDRSFNFNENDIPNIRKILSNEIINYEIESVFSNNH